MGIIHSNEYKGSLAGYWAWMNEKPWRGFIVRRHNHGCFESAYREIKGLSKIYNRLKNEYGDRNESEIL